MISLAIVSGIAGSLAWLHLIAESEGWKGLWKGVVAFIIVVTISSISKPFRQAMEGISNSQKPSEARGNLQQVGATRKLY